MFTSVAHAMTGGAGGAGGAGGGFGALVPLVLMFVIFYFLLIRPQQKKAKAHRELLSQLKKGDRVITSGGLYGTITGVKDGVLTIEIAPKIRVKVSQGHVSGLAGGGPSQTPATTEESSDDEKK